MQAARRVALVTGGARRVGAEIVRGMAARGYDVLLHHGQSPRDAAALAAELTQAHGVRVEIIQEDLRDADAPARIVGTARQLFGGVDVLVSSASVMEYMTFGTVTPEQWAETEAVNLRAPFFLMQAIAPVMRDGGVIVQLSDHLAFETLYPNLIPHQVTKAAVTTLVDTMAAVLAPRIRVNAVAPGLVLAPDSMSEDTLRRFLADVPLGRSGTPQDVVQAIHYLIDAGYVTGEVLRVDGGRHLRR